MLTEILTHSGTVIHVDLAKTSPAMLNIACTALGGIAIQHEVEA